MGLKVGDIVIIPPDRPGPRVGKLKKIFHNPVFPELSKCVVERELSYVFGIRLKDLKKYEEGENLEEVS